MNTPSTSSKPLRPLHASERAFWEKYERAVLQSPEVPLPEGIRQSGMKELLETHPGMPLDLVLVITMITERVASVEPTAAYQAANRWLHRISRSTQPSDWEYALLTDIRDRYRAEVQRAMKAKKVRGEQKENRVPLQKAA